MIKIPLRAALIKAAVTAVAFKDGQPVNEPSMSTFNLSRKGQGVTLSPRETAAEADEVVVELVVLVVQAVEEEMTRPVMPNILVMLTAVVWTMDLR